MSENFTFENENICSYIKGSISVIKLKQNVFSEVVELVNSKNFFHILSVINNSKEIDALLLINESKALGSFEYKKFIRENVVGDKNSMDVLRFKSEHITINRAREINVLKRFILKLVDFNKIIVSGLSGEVVTPFFGLSLSSNFRFATENMKYMLDHKNYGLHPSGALPFFLKRYVNWSKQNEILYSKDEILAAEARDLGIIDKIFPEEKFEENCILELNKIIEKNKDSINKTRILMSYPISDLKDYFEKEALFI